ncbi:MAG: oxygenase MpaB family protein [Mycobacteriales bacterium]
MSIVDETSISSHARVTRRPMRDGRPAANARQVSADFDIRKHIFGFASNVAGASNVIMQLSWPGVGYGVKESTVDSGNALKHPVKRGRTTFTYLAVALLGTDEDRAHFRRAVNKQHVQVRSTDASPVEYSAMDPELQLWVAACLYYGTVDISERMFGPMDDQSADDLYAYCARFGTSLQVRDGMWPADRDAFAAYWQEGVAKAHIDEPIRQYLDSLSRLENLPAVFRRRYAEKSMFWTRGFLPPEFRAQMGYSWSEDEEAELNRRMRRLGRVQRLLPTPVRIFPFNLLLWDMRRRYRKGIALV